MVSVQYEQHKIALNASDLLSVAQARYGTFVADDTKLPNGM